MRDRKRVQKLYDVVTGLFNVKKRKTEKSTHFSEVILKI